jgi:hypothetical protein
VHEAVSSSSSSPLPRLFGPSILGRVPSSSQLTLRSTALRLVGAYSSWFSSQAQQPEEACLLSAVTFVVAGLEEPGLGPDAARALRLLCDANRKTLVGHVGSFVAVLGGLEGKVEVRCVLHCALVRGIGAECLLCRIQSWLRCSSRFLVSFRLFRKIRLLNRYW